ncbi:MAG: hypothetical protein OXC27_00450 [Caldilineaceae bacterium]|nr:hypothetical protein [Caldilineaceae bacterium]
MSLWTINPVKPLNEGKSRLVGHISPRQRQTLNRELLTCALAAISQAHLDVQILVVSRDSQALAVAKHAGTRALAEESQPRTAPSPCSPNDAESEPQLYAALTQAARYAATHGATKDLVLPTDMPNLTTEEVRPLASPTNRDPQIIIAPSRDSGTNALMLQPAQAIYPSLSDATASSATSASSQRPASRSGSSIPTPCSATKTCRKTTGSSLTAVVRR